MQETPALSDQPISLGDIARLLWRGRYYFIVGTLAGAFAGVALSFVQTPVYRAEAVIVPLDPVDGSSMLSGLSSQLGDLAALAGVGGNSGDFRREALAYLRSRTIVNKLIVERKLMAEISDCDPATAPKCRRTMSDAVRKFRNSLLNISEDRRSGLVTVAVEWEDPQKAADWANEIVRLANEDLRSRAINEAETTQQYLSEQIVKIPTVEVRAAVYRLIEAQLKQASVARSRLDYAFRVIDTAAVSDLDDEVRPNKPLIAIVWGMLGAGVAFVVLLVRRRPRARAQDRASAQA